jgi:sulfatase modifying factor 1
VRLDPAYDIYSLAAMYIRLRTGQFPFGRGEDMRQRKQRGEFHSLGMPPAVVDVLRAALSADPRGRRYNSATEFAARLWDATDEASRAVRGAAHVEVGPGGRGRFVDRVELLKQREAAELEGQRNQVQEARRQRLEAFDRQLEQYLDTGRLPLAYGTVLALLRDDVGNSEYQALKKHLEEKDLRTGQPRCCDANGQRYALIPNGEFLMGSSESPRELKIAFPKVDVSQFEREWPRHRVVITRPFFLALYPTTVAQWRQFVQATGYVSEGERDGKGGHGLNSKGRWEQRPEFTWHSPGFLQGPDHPVTLVSRNDCVEFMKWHRGLTGLESGFPTEAEWEYACRASTTTRHYAGDDLEALAKIANVADASARKKWDARESIQADDGFAYTSPVGSFEANPWGLYDLLGNVWEYCFDRFDPNYYQSSPVEDPKGPNVGELFVIRGGSWTS